MFAVYSRSVFSSVRCWNQQNSAHENLENLSLSCLINNNIFPMNSSVCYKCKWHRVPCGAFSISTEFLSWNFFSHHGHSGSHRRVLEETFFFLLEIREGKKTCCRKKKNFFHLSNESLIFSLRQPCRSLRPRMPTRIRWVTTYNLMRQTATVLEWTVKTFHSIGYVFFVGLWWNLMNA